MTWAEMKQKVALSEDILQGAYGFCKSHVEGSWMLTVGPSYLGGLQRPYVP